MLLALDLDGYVVEVMLAAHDDRLAKRLETSFAAAKFFEPSEVQQYAGAKAKLYEGPAMSAHRLATLEGDPPASHIRPPGRITSAEEYQNRGFQVWRTCCRMDGR